MSVIPVFVIKDNVGQFAKDKRVVLSKDVEWSFINGANERLVSPVKERNIVLVRCQAVLDKLLKCFPIGNYFVGVHNFNFYIVANGKYKNSS